MRIALLALFVVAGGCHTGTSDPGYHLPRKKMEQILVDVSMAETYSALQKDGQFHVNVKNLDSLSVYYSGIFTHYGVTREEFTKSMAWYQSHPNELDSVLSHVLPRLSSMQQQYSTQLPKKDTPLPMRKPGH